ncbi:NB-ARC domain-containing protein [Streptomyces sp. NPDC002851]
MLGAALTAWRQEQSSTSEGNDPPPPAAPRVPEWVVDRTESKRAEAAVCGGRRAVGITTSLWGAGGFGKTTLAAMICASPRVRRRFKGRTYTIVIGRDVRGRADIAAKVAEATRFITGDTAPFTDPDLAGDHLGRLLDRRGRTLLVLDDVWEQEQLEPFLRGGRHCVRLVTTRVPSLLPPGTQSVQVDQMSLEQARTMLTWELNGLPPQMTGALLDATGRWALLLRLVNRQLKAQADTGRPLARAAEDVLATLRDQGPQGVDSPWAEVDVNDPASRRRAVRATVEAATSLLPAGGAERFAELAVFVEDEAVPMALVAQLWLATGGLAEAQSHALCAELASLSLLSQTSDNGGRISLHDVVRDYLRSTLAPSDLAALHAQLVDAAAVGLPDAAPLVQYGPGPRTAWWQLADGYLQEHLIEHLVGAGRTDQAEAVAGDLRWVETRLVRHGANAPQRDLSHIPTAEALSRARSLAQVTHLLAPTDPARAVLNTLYTRLAPLSPWRDQVAVRQNDPASYPLLVGLRPPPDLPSQALLSILTGHADAVTSVAISPDNTWLASADPDGMVRIWDRVSGKCTATFDSRTNAVLLEISPDGTWLASSGDDRTVRLWDRASGECTATLIGHTNDVVSLEISPDGTWLATGDVGGTVRVWDRASGQCTTIRTGHHLYAVVSLEISPDGTWFATGDVSGTVRLWDGVSGRCTATLRGHMGSVVSSLEISPDGTWLASSGADGTVRLWDRASGECTATLIGHTETVKSVAISPDGTWLASSSDDRTVRLWDRASGECTATLIGHTETVKSVAISSDGTWLASASEDRTVRLWDRESGRCTATLSGHTEAVKSVAISSDGTWLASASEDRTVRLWDRESGQCTATLSGHTAPVESVAISPDGAWLAAVCLDRRVCIWNVPGRRIATFVRTDDYLWTCAWAENLKVIGDAGVHVFELRM